jgi:hypothetical protein
MKDLSYKPANEDIRKRFIGWKLQQISRKQRHFMDAERRKAGLLVENVQNQINSTEKLLESFYPNVQRIMNEK